MPGAQHAWQRTSYHICGIFSHHNAYVVHKRCTPMRKTAKRSASVIWSPTPSICTLITQHSLNPYANIFVPRLQVLNPKKCVLNPNAKSFLQVLLSSAPNIELHNSMQSLKSIGNSESNTIIQGAIDITPDAISYFSELPVPAPGVTNSISSDPPIVSPSICTLNTSLNAQNLTTTAFSEFSENYNLNNFDNVHFNFSNNQSETNMSLLDATPCVNEISTPLLSEVDPYENPQHVVSLPPYYTLFCNILSALLYICICIPIRSGHGSFNNKFSISTPLEKEHMSHINDDRDPYKLLKSIKVSNVNRLVIGQLNINSLRNKFEALKLIIGQNIDILIITETKLDETFTKAQFHIDGYALPFRIDCSRHSGGVIIYVRGDITANELIGHHTPTNLEGIFLEINLKNRKWLVFGGYNHNKQNINNFVAQIGPIIDYYMSKYENLLLLGDFNSEMS